MFNIMNQNMDYNIGRLLGTAGKSGGLRYFDPVPPDQLSNTIIIFIGDNGTPFDVTLEEAKTEIFEGGVRVPMIFTDGQALMNEINGEAVAPRFQHSSRINATAAQMIHVVDLYKTIVCLADSAANAFPSNTDSRDFTVVLKNPLIQRTSSKGSGSGGTKPGTPGVLQITPPVRVFNFSQWYASDGTRATLRNGKYKLNYDETTTPEYQLFQYVDSEVPGLENDPAAVDLYSDALNGTNADAQTNLNLLLDELLANYQRDETDVFPDPR